MQRFHRLRSRNFLRPLILGGLLAGLMFFGIGGTLGARPQYAGMVYGKKVPARLFVEQQRVVMRSIAPGFGISLPDEAIELATWQRLALLEETRRQRLSVPDTDVVATIQHFPVFQRDGQFDVARYEQFLNNLRLAPRQFEEEVRQQLLLEQLRARITGDVEISEGDARRAFETDVAYQRAQMAYVPIEFRRFESAAQQWVTANAPSLAATPDATTADTSQRLSYQEALTAEQRETFVRERAKQLAQERALSIRERLQQAGSDGVAITDVLDREGLHLIGDDQPLGEGDHVAPLNMQADPLVAAARVLAPDAWSQPIEGPEAWVLGRLVQLVAPDEATWQQQREAYLASHGLREQEARWQDYVAGSLARANVVSYLKRPAARPAPSAAPFDPSTQEPTPASPVPSDSAAPAAPAETR